MTRPVSAVAPGDVAGAIAEARGYLECPLCGWEARNRRSLASHKGRDRCRVLSTHRDMAVRGWRPLSLVKREVVQRAGVPHERAPGEFHEMRWRGGRPHGGAIDSIWVPRWVEVVLEATDYQQEQTQTELLRWVVQQPDMPAAIEVCFDLGGAEAVKRMVETSW